MKNSASNTFYVKQCNAEQLVHLAARYTKEVYDRHGKCLIKTKTLPNGDVELTWSWEEEYEAEI